MHPRVAQGASDDLDAPVVPVEADLADRITAELFWQRSDFDRNGNARELSFCNNPAAVLAAIGIYAIRSRLKTKQP